MKYGRDTVLPDFFVVERSQAGKDLADFSLFHAVFRKEALRNLSRFLLFDHFIPVIASAGKFPDVMEQRRNNGNVRIDAFLLRQKNPLTVSPPGGETVRQVQERVLSAIQDILLNHPYGRVAVVSHGFALAVIRVRFLGLPIEQVWNMVPENDEVHELDVPA